MPRVVLAVVVLCAAPACQTAEASRNPLAASQRRMASRLDALEHRVNKMRARERRLGDAADRYSARIATVAGRLHDDAAALALLKGKLAGVHADVAAAAAAASAVGDQEASLARRLSILEKRFEYHLKHDPGSS